MGNSEPETVDTGICIFMICESCHSRDSVEPYTFVVFGVGVMQMLLCAACRIQFQIQLWRGQKAA